MKKIFVSLVALGCFILSASAQDSTTTARHKPDMKNNFHHQREMMMKQLNLTPDQKEKLKASREGFRKQMTALNQDESITVKDYRDRKYTLRKEQKMQFLHILTPDQKTKLDQIKKDEKANRELMEAKRIDKLKTQLNLSDEQVATIKANRQARQTKVEAIIQNDNLSRTDKKEQLTAIRDANKDSIKSVLTPDQLNKWEELKKQRMQDRMNRGVAQ